MQKKIVKLAFLLLIGAVAFTFAACKKEEPIKAANGSDVMLTKPQSVEEPPDLKVAEGAPSYAGVYYLFKMTTVKGNIYHKDDLKVLFESGGLSATSYVFITDDSNLTLVAAGSTRNFTYTKGENRLTAVDVHGITFELILNNNEIVWNFPDDLVGKDEGYTYYFAKE